MKKLKCIDSDLLKILAMIFMLLDHLWGTVVSGNQWMTFVGRLAFPIFAFLVAEGFVHTSDLKKYAKRLFLFGIISEIPFNLMLTASPFFPFHQNVMFTLLLGLLCINEIDKFEKAPSVKNGIVRLLMIALFLIIGAVGFVDYGVMGIAVVIVFYVFRGFKLAFICRLISLILLFIVFFKGTGVEYTLFGKQFFFPFQGLGVLALIPISLYNGEKRSKSKAVKYAFYSFYPAHMLLIYIIYRLFF